MRRLIISLCMLFVAPAWATTYYIATTCATGAAVECDDNGNNANDGLSAGSPKRDLTWIDWGTIGSGHTFLLARGGALDVAQQITENITFTFGTYEAPGGLSCSAAAVDPDWPHTVGGTYLPDSCKPILRVATGNVFNVGGGTPSIDNVRLINPDTSGWGIFLSGSNVTTGATITNVKCEGFDICVFAQNAPTGSKHNRLTLRHNYLNGANSMGWLGCSSESVIEANTFEEANNKPGAAGTSHGMYYGCASSTATNTVIRHNLFLNNSVDTDVSRCTGGNLTTHGQLDGLVIEGNRIIQDGSFSGACYGISLNPGYDSEEFHRNIVVRGNTVHNTACGICVTAAPNVIIENNHIYTAFDFAPSLGIVVPERPFSQDGGAEDRDDNATIRNNTIRFTTAHSTSRGIRTTNTGSGPNLADMGTSVVVANNLILVSGSAYCFQLETPAAPDITYEAITHNVCNGGLGWNPSHTTASAFNTQFGATNSIDTAIDFTATPTAANSWSCAVNSGSPAIDAANATYASRRAIKSIADATRDIGACGRAP